MSFEGSRATIIKNLSGFTARVDSSGFLYTQLGSASLSVSVSGNPVAIVQGSGQNGVFLTNQSGNVLVNVNESGQLVSNISGQTMALWGGSGRNPTYITNQSGNVAANVITNNLAVAISDDGTTVASVATLADNTTAFNAVGTWATLFAWDETAGRFNRVRSTISGAPAAQGGTQFRLFADTTQAGSNLRTAGIVAISDASGGAALSTSASCIHGITIRPISGAINAMIHIGSSGSPPWISGGLGIDIGESRELKVHNPAFVRVFARVSGTMVSWAGVDF